MRSLTGMATGVAPICPFLWRSNRANTMLFFLGPFLTRSHLPSLTSSPILKRYIVCTFTREKIKNKQYSCQKCNYMYILCFQLQRNNVEDLIADSFYSQLPQCFQRPLDNKVNFGIGCPKFASHELLVEGGKYVKGDTLFIKVTTSEKLTTGRVLDLYRIYIYITKSIYFNFYHL